MKWLLALLLLVTAPAAIWAQGEVIPDDEDEKREETVGLRIPTQVGNYMVGADLFFARARFQKGVEANYNIGLMPKIGVFILPNIALGLSLDLNIEGQKGYRSISYGASPFARFYFGKNYAGHARPLQFFVETGVGFGGTNSHYDGVGGTTKVTTNGIRLYVLPGLDYFLNDRIALETGLQYLFIGGKPDAHIVGVNIGFQAFLGR